MDVGIGNSGLLGAYVVGAVNFGFPISQTLTGLTPGERYQVAFYSRNSNVFQDGFPPGVQASFAGEVFTVFGTGESYQQYSFFAVANSSTELLTLAGENVQYTVWFDDISVVAAPVPELDPQSWLTAVALAMGLGFLVQKRPARAGGRP